MKKNIIPIVGVLLGGLGGFLYWKFVGCSTGTCPITSKPLNSSVYGGLMGFLMAGIIADLFKKN